MSSRGQEECALFKCAKKCEDYYRQAVSIPFLEHVIKQFERRFNSNSSIIVSGVVLVPKLLVSQVKEQGPGSWNASICELANHYAEDFPLKFKLKAEMDIYETFWLKEDERLTKEDIPGNYYYSWNILNTLRCLINSPPPPLIIFFKIPTPLLLGPPPPLIKLLINVVRKFIYF